MSFTELPKHWEVAQVKDIASSIQYGYTESSSAENVGPKFLRITDIQENKVDWKSVPYCKIADDAKSKYQLQDGDLVFARTGATVGKSFLIKGEVPDAIFASYLIRLRFPKEISDKFVYNFFQSHLYWKQIVEGQVGIGQPNVNGTKLGQLFLPLPPLAEQQRIVAKLEELFSELDAGLASLKTAAQQLKTYRQAVLKWAFEGKLTNDHVTDGELPAGWKWVKLGELMESVRNGYSKKPDDKGNVPILRISSVRPFKIDLSDRRFLEKPLDEINSVAENDLLFTRYNGSRDFVGVCARVPALKEAIYYPDKLIRCRPVIKAEAHAAYLQYAANVGRSRQFVVSRIKTTAGQTGISGEEIKSIPIPLCSLEEQHRIVQEIESRLSVCDKLEDTLAAALRQAEALRQSILKQAFAGKLVAPKESDKLQFVAGSRNSLFTETSTN